MNKLHTVVTNKQILLTFLLTIVRIESFEINV